MDRSEVSDDPNNIKNNRPEIIMQTPSVEPKKIILSQTESEFKTLKIGYRSKKNSYFDLFTAVAGEFFNIVQDDINPHVVFMSERIVDSRRPSSSSTVVYMSDEIYEPDYNCCDVSISSNWDRQSPSHFHMPVFMLSPYIYRKGHLLPPSGVYKRETIDNMLKIKSRFCSLVSSDPYADMRYCFTAYLQKYKPVDIAGAVVGCYIPDKFTFQSRAKFAIAFENASAKGYITEKVWDAIASITIPIYWGSNEIGKFFNIDRLIHINSFADFSRAREKIIGLDLDDEQYTKWLLKPVYSDSFDPNTKMDEFRSFVFSVCQEALRKKEAAASMPETAGLNLHQRNRYPLRGQTVSFKTKLLDAIYLRAYRVYLSHILLGRKSALRYKFSLFLLLRVRGLMGETVRIMPHAILPRIES